MRKLVFKLLALLPFVALAASIASPEVRAHMPINAAVALMFPWWIVLFVAYALTGPKSEADAALRMTVGSAKEALAWPSMTGTVKRLGATGMSQGKDRLVEFTLGFEGTPPREVVHQQMVPELAFVQLRVDAPLVVHVNPDAPDQVYIDWNATFPGSVLTFAAAGLLK